MPSTMSLSNFVTSVFAIDCVPLPSVDPETTKIMKSIVLTDLDSPDVLFPPFGSLGPPPGARPTLSPFLALSKPVWRNTDLSAVTNYVLRHMQIVHTFPNSRNLVLAGNESDQSSQTRNPVATRSKETSFFSVRKGECMYRTNWNKKKPFGVSNIIYSDEARDPSSFAKLVLSCEVDEDSKIADILWTLRMNCLCTDLEDGLGLVCPLPPTLEEIRSFSPEFVFKKLESLKLTTPEDRVVFHVSRILKRIIPRALWGNGVHWRQAVKQYLSLSNRFETIDTESIKTCVLRFLKSETRKKLFASKTINFIFKRIVIPLISYLFYVTDTDGGDIVFFRRPVWDVLVSKSSLGLVDLVKLEKFYNNSRAEGSSVRWIPKTNGGLRPVVRQPKLVKERTKRLLRYLKALTYKFRERVGHSVFSRDALHLKLIDFVNFRKNSQNPIYFVSGDIQNCYESIPLEGLDKALRYFCENDSLTFSSLMVTATGSSGILRKSPVVFVENDFDNLIDQLPRNAVISSQGGLMAERKSYGQMRQEIMSIVRTNCYWLSTKGSTTNKVLYSVTSQGLPQGSSFSGILVAIYYGFIDRISFNIPKEIACTVRLVDDMLCLTEDASVAKTLAENLNFARTYGPVNESKTTNGVIENGKSELQWAGFTIRPSHGRFNLSMQMKTFPSNVRKRSKSSLMDLLRFALARSVAQYSLPILFDPKLNSKKFVSDNAYRAGLVAGNRIAGFLKTFCAKEDEEGVEIFLKKLEKFGRKRMKNKQLFRQFRLGLECGIRKNS